jgi:superfamily II DNA/RNA helicase
MAVQPWDKRRLIKLIVDREKPDLMLVFCRTKATVDKVAEHLCRKKIDAKTLHADMAQNQRDRVMEQLREGKVHVIVASDLAARGIDVKGITHVVNYDVPDDPEVYVHRIGRTARAGCDGRAIMFVTPDQGALVDGIMTLTNTEIHEYSYDDFEDSPPPERDRRRQEAQAKAKATEVENKSRQPTLQNSPVALCLPQCHVRAWAGVCALVDRDHTAACIKRAYCAQCHRCTRRWPGSGCP